MGVWNVALAGSALVFFLSFAATPSQAQTLRVYSELTRIDPFEKIVPQDRGAAPRHILSPAVPRNAYSSFRLVVSLDTPQSFTIDVGQNPENAVRISLYKEVYEKHGDAWIPDRLLPVSIPYEGSVPDIPHPAPGQTAVTLWMDLWVPPDAPINRIKVEPQLYANDEWTSYPMEVRIISPVVPKVSYAFTPLPAVTEPADTATFGILLREVCGKPQGKIEAPLTARRLIQRNTIQHLALARGIEGVGGAESFAIFFNPAGVESIDAWCASPKSPPSLGPEWYLKFRDAIFQRVPGE